VLSRDITEIVAEEIINTEVLATYISGKKVYEKKNL
jgi:predicted amidohydrolase YtcJ